MTLVDRFAESRRPFGPSRSNGADTPGVSVPLDRADIRPGLERTAERFVGKRTFTPSARTDYHSLAERTRDLCEEEKQSIGVRLGVVPFERPVVTIGRVDTGACCK